MPALYSRPNQLKFQARLCASKELLVEQATSENKMLFEKPPELQQLNHLLRIIFEEMAEYRIWPVSRSRAQLTKPGSLTH